MIRHPQIVFAIECYHSPFQLGEMLTYDSEHCRMSMANGWAPCYIPLSQSCLLDDGMERKNSLMKQCWSMKLPYKKQCHQNTHWF